MAAPAPALPLTHHTGPAALLSTARRRRIRPAHGQGRTRAGRAARAAATPATAPAAAAAVATAPRCDAACGVVGHRRRRRRRRCAAPEGQNGLQDRDVGAARRGGGPELNGGALGVQLRGRGPVGDARGRDGEAWRGLASVVGGIRAREVAMVDKGAARQSGESEVSGMTSGEPAASRAHLDLYRPLAERAKALNSATEAILWKWSSIENHCSATKKARCEQHEYRDDNPVN
ncbi:uncharacterized protein THITE_110007 [Thermothielavioides terrestris NRRL 8126]|uniref:Uncharacterized protein n=1 Tax=Thermothielavioides terrestris (strain ATCC 38088 / NRRL 8126) TaxID=578455 RepID=G2QZS2_THETT|nr:uncharacterized protein THITE_110007 [Thermothielavioides terrestris NRRL 8126]AEO67197.1 hypothetical protein THITE_110007 [Thermothielavioides terrestris NRRL 8126]